MNDTYSKEPKPSKRRQETTPRRKMWCFLLLVVFVALVPLWPLVFTLPASFQSSTRFAVDTAVEKKTLQRNNTVHSNAIVANENDADEKPLSVAAAESAATTSATTSATTASNDDSSTTMLWWEHMQEAICPNYQPSAPKTIRLGHLLFELARNELPVANTNVTTTAKKIKSMARDSTFYNYTRKSIDAYFKGLFNGFWHVEAPSDPSSTSTPDSVVYLREFKCGNNNIGSWAGEMQTKLGWKKRHFKKFRDLSRLMSQKHVCFVTAIRDPIAKFMSGYNEVDFRTHRDGMYLFGKHGRHTPLEKRKYWRKHGLSPEFFYYQSDPEWRFEVFLTQLLYMDPAVWMNRETKHVYPMMRILEPWRRAVSNQGNGTESLKPPKLHISPTTVNLTFVWPGFVDQACSGTSTSEWAQFHNISNNIFMPNVNGHESSLDLRGTYAAAKAQWKKGGHVARALCLLHLPDYACWRDLPDGVPSLCLKVYKEPKIYQAIWNVLNMNKSNTI